MLLIDNWPSCVENVNLMTAKQHNVYEKVCYTTNIIRKLCNRPFVRFYANRYRCNRQDFLLSNESYDKNH